MKMFLNRLLETKHETLGVLTVFSTLVKVFECKTLEPPFKFNRKNVSCIPKGTYKVKARYSERHGRHLIITGVDGRSYILAHPGNFYEDTKGCILVGKEYTHINSDKELDVSASRQTMSNLMSVVDEYLRDHDYIELAIN